MKKLLLVLFLFGGCQTYKNSETYKAIENTRQETQEIKKGVQDINTSYQKLIYEKKDCLDIELNNRIISINEKMNNVFNMIDNIEVIWKGELKVLNSKIQIKNTIILFLSLIVIYYVIRDIKDKLNIINYIKDLWK